MPEIYVIISIAIIYLMKNRSVAILLVRVYGQVFDLRIESLTSTQYYS